jgi:tetratricopeptide (TPR) repeat protein
MDKKLLDKAIILYRAALEIDSTYAPAWHGLAETYQSEQNEYFTLNERVWDSAYTLLNIALSYDDKFELAYLTLSRYYLYKNMPDQARECLEKAIEYNPNNWFSYVLLSELMRDEYYDYVAALNYLHSTGSRVPKSSYPRYYMALRQTYNRIGFLEKGRYYNDEGFKQKEEKKRWDTLFYLSQDAGIDWAKGNNDEAFRKHLEIEQKGFSGVDLFKYIAHHYEIRGNYEKAYDYELILQNWSVANGVYNSSLHRLGYVQWQLGRRDEANQHLSEAIKKQEENVNQGDVRAHFILAGIYTLIGDKEKGYYHLERYTDQKFFNLGQIRETSECPMFDNIRGETRYQEIIRNMETKYQRERERVEKWLKENEML